MRFPIGPLTGLALLLSLPPIHAHATATADPDAWAARFAAAAGSGDGTRITAVAAEIAHPTLPREKLAGTINGVLNHMAGRHVAFSERFPGRDIGTFFKRVMVAVSYGDQFLFFSADLVRDPDGWQLHAFDMNTDLDELLSDPLPFN